MKVYVVLLGDEIDTDGNIESIFSTRDNAERYIAHCYEKFQDTKKHREVDWHKYYIEEFTLDDYVYFNSTVDHDKELCYRYLVKLHNRNASYIVSIKPMLAHKAKADSHEGDYYIFYDKNKNLCIEDIQRRFEQYYSMIVNWFDE